MLNFPANVTIYLHTAPTDMRKGIDGLSGLVRGQFAEDPTGGSLYLFANRRRDRLKMLYWDGTGYWIFYKVLEQGTFEVTATDDTRVTLIVPENIPPPLPGDLKSQWAYENLSAAQEQGKPSVTARIWAYRSVTIPLTFFDFTVSRERAGPDLVLQDFSGKLMADCYSGYQQIELHTDGRIERGACGAHARRKVFEARDNYPREASIVLAMFQQLYDIEDRGKAMAPEARLELRQSEALPVWDALGAWLESKVALDVLPKSKFGGALGYLRNHWEPLQLYLTDPLMPIDNNDVEQLMKQVALGRKNWLFIGSLAAGDRAAGFFTLVSSALRRRPGRVGLS